MFSCVSFTLSLIFQWNIYFGVVNQVNLVVRCEKGGTQIQSVLIVWWLNWDTNFTKRCNSNFSFCLVLEWKIFKNISSDEIGDLSDFYLQKLNSLSNLAPNVVACSIHLSSEVLNQYSWYYWYSVLFQGIPS